MSMTQQVKPDGSYSGTTERKRSIWRVFLEQREITVGLVVVALAVFLSIASPNFLNRANLLALVLGLSFNAIVAVGMTVLMVSGGFDLSVGSTLALAGALAGYAMVFWHVPIPVAILIGLLAGAVVGLGNGLLVAKVGVNPLIATLGMMSVVRGLVLLITSGFGIPNLPDGFNVIAQGKAHGHPVPCLRHDRLCRGRRHSLAPLALFPPELFRGRQHQERASLRHPRRTGADRQLHHYRRHGCIGRLAAGRSLRLLLLCLPARASSYRSSRPWSSAAPAWQVARAR